MSTCNNLKTASRHHHGEYAISIEGGREDYKDHFGGDEMPMTLLFNCDCDLKLLLSKK